MPASRDLGDDDASEKPPLVERLKAAFLKPAPAGTEKTAPRAAHSVEELEAAVKSADDKERLIGLIAAPCAAAISILVISALVANDPAHYLKNGQVNKLYVPLSTYHALTVVLLVLSVLILLTALLRKRLFLGIALALYGLAVFNLHYWGFGVPFVLGGAWFLVRAYRMQRELREARGERPPGDAGAVGSARPRANRRYTPPTASRTR